MKRKDNMDLESSHSNKAMSTINLLGELKLESLLSFSSLQNGWVGWISKVRR